MVAITLLAFTSCENSLTRKYGGSMEYELKPNEKFINVTWKDDNLWVITQDTTTNVYYAREKSKMGVFEGVVIIKPKK